MSDQDSESERLRDELDLSDDDVVRLLAAQSVLFHKQPQFKDEYLAAIREQADKYGVPVEDAIPARHRDE